MTATQGAQLRGAGQDGGRGPRTVGSTLRAYVALTKPRIIELLLITTIPTMFLAAGGFPSLWLIIATMVGGYLAAGGANALNMYLERDIDAKMKRTRKRPIPSGAVTPRAALVFGLTISAVSALWLGVLVNWVSAALAVGAILLYVVFYTMILKRRTSQNIVWGGIAGCMPVLIGWSAVTGTVSWTAVLLFLVIFFWTPPHYWPLSMKVKEDYARVGVPMLPVIATNTVVARQIVFYSWVMVGVSLLLWPLG
ncbi:MAG: heme o synthase, partial [Brachybacterium paraconglomeratum]|nr:heme o synthase [Brachybacterium paraconglomeratum]